MRCCGRCMARTISKRASWLSHFLGQYWGLLVSPSNVFTSSSPSALLAMERATGIEPAYPAWEAGALPLSYARNV